MYLLSWLLTLFSKNILCSRCFATEAWRPLVCRRLDEADYDTVFTTLTHLPQDMNEEAVCAHIKDMYLKIPASEYPSPHLRLFARINSFPSSVSMLNWRSC